MGHERQLRELWQREHERVHDREREAIDKAIVGGGPAGEVSARFGVSDRAVDRHSRGHVTAAIMQHAGKEAAAAANSVLGQMLDLQRRTLAILARAEPLAARDLAITGKDLMTELGVPAGPALGRTLAAVLDDVERETTYDATPSVWALPVVLLDLAFLALINV